MRRMIGTRVERFMLVVEGKRTALLEVTRVRIRPMICLLVACGLDGRKSFTVLEYLLFAGS
jgi:hypothetical protein